MCILHTVDKNIYFRKSQTYPRLSGPIHRTLPEDRYIPMHGSQKRPQTEILSPSPKEVPPNYYLTLLSDPGMLLYIQILILSIFDFFYRDDVGIPNIGNPMYNYNGLDGYLAPQSSLRGKAPNQSLQYPDFHNQGMSKLILNCLQSITDMDFITKVQHYDLCKLNLRISNISIIEIHISKL